MAQVLRAYLKLEREEDEEDEEPKKEKKKKAREESATFTVVAPSTSTMSKLSPSYIDMRVVRSIEGYVGGKHKRTSSPKIEPISSSV